MKKTMRVQPARRNVPVCLALLVAGPVMAATLTGHPPAGDYRIDSDSTITHTTVAGTLKTEQHIEGATGRTTVTQTAPGGPPVSRVLAGEGPYSVCLVEPTAPPPRGVGTCATGTYKASPGGSTASVDCGALKLDQQWRRIDDRTWERVLHTSHSTVALNNSGSPAAAMEMAMAGMSPEERARARVELAKMPSAADRDAAMAPVIAKLEEQARTGSPSDAAMAREQLAMMKGRSSGAPDTFTDVRERWTRVADVCKAKR
jgi:hypothetical protein